MYTKFFGINEEPFSITPDPRYLFMSERHSEALAHLVYGVTESGGFIQLTGEVGTGKTMLVRTLLLSRLPDNADVAVVLNPQITAHEFLLTICEELGIPVPDNVLSIKALTDSLNRHLLAAHAAGRRTILVVDEAQNLAPAVLEQVRLLTNLETAKKKLLQIILIGQPELRDLLDRNDLRQLAQRVTGRYHLEPLTRDETSHYIEHRLRVAGALGEIFENTAKSEVYRLSKGVPRLINVICDRALLGAYTEESRKVNTRLVKRAAAEVAGVKSGFATGQRLAIVAGAAAVAVIAGSLWYLSTSSVEANAPGPATTDIAQAAGEVTAREPTTEPESVASPGESLAEATARTGPTLADEIALAGELTSTEFALAAMFDLWGIEYARGAQSGCAQAAAAGLACLWQRGSWSGLQQLNRPAILTITDADGDAHQVVLTGIEDDVATLSIGGVKVSHPIDEITDMWLGQFMLLWRPPEGSSDTLQPGASGTGVTWLRQSLGAIDARYRTTANDTYDQGLVDVVRRFQRDNRLPVDGLAGKKTLIVINSLLAPDDSPRLVRLQAETPTLARE